MNSTASAPPADATAPNPDGASALAGARRPHSLLATSHSRMHRRFRLAAATVALALLPGLGLVTSVEAAAKTSVSLLAARTVAKNKAVVITGHAKNVTSPTKRTAKLQQLKGAKWSTVAAEKLNSKATYSFSRRMPKLGTFSFRVRLYSGSKLLATSPTGKVKVVAKVVLPVKRAISPPASSGIGVNLRGWHCSSPQHYAYVAHPYVSGATQRVWWYQGLFVDGQGVNHNHDYGYSLYAQGTWLYYTPGDTNWRDLNGRPAGGVQWSNLPEQWHYSVQSLVFVGDTLVASDLEVIETWRDVNVPHLPPYTECDVL